LIKSFSSSMSYADANEKMSSLKMFQANFNKQQIIEIIRGGFGNSQVYDEGYQAGPFVRNLILSNTDKINEVIKLLKTDLESLFGQEDSKHVTEEYVKDLLEARFKINLG